VNSICIDFLCSQQEGHIHSEGLGRIPEGFNMGGGRGHSTSLGVGMGHTHAGSFILREGLFVCPVYPRGTDTWYFRGKTCVMDGISISIYFNPDWRKKNIIIGKHYSQLIKQ
jgi:hypothetical protein